jgi:NADH:ubiquinone oxidoreductase subunit D
MIWRAPQHPSAHGVPDLSATNTFRVPDKEIARIANHASTLFAFAVDFGAMPPMLRSFGRDDDCDPGAGPVVPTCKIPYPM